MPRNSPNGVLEVFVSYTRESEEHAEWVANLVDALESEDDFHIVFDDYDLYAGSDLTKFMERVDQADKVVIVLTPTYVAKADKRVGGAGYEAGIMTASLLASPGTDKLIPALRDGDEVPAYLKTKTRVDFRDDDLFVERLEDLKRAIRGDARRPRPLKKSRSSDNLSPSPIPASHDSSDERIRLSLGACEELNERVHDLVEQGKWSFVIGTARPTDLTRAEDDFLSKIRKCERSLFDEAAHIDREMKARSASNSLLAMASNTSEEKIRAAFVEAGRAVSELANLRNVIRSKNLTRDSLRSEPLYERAAAALNAILDAYDHRDEQRRKSSALSELYRKR